MVKYIWKAALSTMVLFIHVCIAAGYIGPPSTFEQDMPQQSVKPNQLKTFVMASYRWVRSVPYHIAASTASPSRLSAQNRTLWRRLIRRRRSVCRRNTFREWSPKSSDVTRMVDERSDGPALGDILAPEERPGSASTAGSGDIPLEPPNFLKRLFSVPKNIRRTAAVGDVVVPVIGARDGWGGIRQGLVNQGIFPGVEYRILEVTTSTESGTEQSISSAREAPESAFDNGDLIFTMRPVYPLVAKLERRWPVRVPAREFPVMLTPFSYNAATAWAALTTSLSLLTVGFVASQALTLSVIPSRSMEPTLQVGDVILVEKLSRASIIRRDDIVFFRPPPALREVVASVGGTLNTRDLFVKRVAGLPGDAVSVNADGIVSVESARPPPASPSPWMTRSSSGNSKEVVENNKMGEEGKSATISGDRGALRATPAAAASNGVLQRIRVEDKKRLPPGTIFVLGDNAEVSMDSRVWGELDEGQVVGHALLRVFPLKAFGLLP